MPSRFQLTCTLFIAIYSSNMFAICWSADFQKVFRLRIASSGQTTKDEQDQGVFQVATSQSLIINILNHKLWSIRWHHCHIELLTDRPVLISGSVADCDVWNDRFINFTLWNNGQNAARKFELSSKQSPRSQRAALAGSDLESFHISWPCQLDRPPLDSVVRRSGRESKIRT